MDLIYALAYQGSVRIDDYPLNTSCKAYFEGHCYHYLEKSIGPSLTGLPVTSCSRASCGWRGWHDGVP